MINKCYWRQSCVKVIYESKCITLNSHISLILAVVLIHFYFGFVEIL